MKLLNNIVLSVIASALLCPLAVCDDSDNYDNPSGETFIYSIAVSNGGMSGADNIPGELDEESGTITFTIPAETDIEAVRFNAKLSLGASLDRESYDASSGEAEIKVVNNLNSSSYRASFTLLEAKETPIVTSIVCRDADGVRHTGFVSDVTGTVYLNCEGSATAEIVEVNMLPKRTVYTLSAGQNGVVSADEPGRIDLDFLGLTASYDLSFAGEPVFGADFGLATVFDYSATATIWSDFAAENTRWAQFDGENMFILSREGGTNPAIVKWDEVKGGSPVSHVLDKTGIEGGTYTISAGGIAEGHFYACNLSTGLAASQPLKVYHWADENAVCETVLDFPGNDAVKGRYGDNMSVTLDESGNGYFWFFSHADGATAVRFRVEGFTNVDAEPEVLIPPYSVAYYASINPVIGEESVYTLTSTYQQSILLVDIDLNLLNRIDPKEGCPSPGKGENDARVINFNGERYLITTNSYGWAYSVPQSLHVYDISSGVNTVMGFTNFAESLRPKLYTYSLSGKNCSAFSANSGAAIGSDGNLRLMAAAPKSGFIFVEVPKKR